MEADHPAYVHTVLDCERPRELAEFYRQFLGLVYRPGDEPPLGGDDPGAEDWLVLIRPDGTRQLAFQRVERLARTTWPEHDVPQQLHIDYLVGSIDDEEEPLYVFADPAGHPFCVFVA